MANGAPTVSNGLVISGVTTSTNVSVASSVTATTYYGSGANLTNITQTTINNNADNRVITGSGSANVLNAESNVHIDGSGRLMIGTTNEGDANADDLTIATTGHTGITLRSGTSNYGQIFFSDAESGTGEYEGIIAYDHSNNSMVFHTTRAEKLRIDSSGRVLIGTTTVGNSDADDLTIANSAHAGITLRSGTSSQGAIYFSDATSGTAQYDGFLGYNQSDRAMFFGTAQATRMRIDSSGRLMLGTSTPGASQVDTFTLETSGHTGMTLFSGTSSRGTIAFGDGRSGNAQYRGVIMYEHSNDSMRFATADQTQMNISSTGQITKPYQASFAAVNTSNGYSLNGQVFPFNDTTHNIGSHFNTSNYRFTAPVAGRYLFTFYSIYNSSGQGRYEILINGAADQKGTRVHMNNSNTNWDNTSTTWILNLAANDYIQMYSQTNTGWHGNHWQRFCGELIS